MRTNVIVCGGREYDDKEFVYQILNKHCSGDVLIIHGAALGADSLANEWAKENHKPVLVFRAEWDKNGKAAGPMRNIKMLKEGLPSLVIAFPGGKGTAHMVSIAMKAGVKVLIPSELT